MKTSMSLRATKSRGNPFLILITLLIMCFTPCQAAVEFGGVDDYIEIPNNPGLIFGASNFSLTAWYKAPASAKQNYRTIISKNYSPIGFWIQTDSLGRVIGGLGGIISVTSTADSFDNAWHHVALVREGTGANQLKIYIDGVLDAQGTDSFVDSATNPIRIGSFTTIPGRNWIGQIDDVRIYNRDLSSNEVEILYKSKSKRTGSQLTNGLVAHYEMDDDAIGKVAAQAKDSSGNLNHGQFIGFDNLVSNGFSNDVPVQIETGYSLEFDGVNDYINIGNTPSLNLTNDLSIVTLIKPNAIQNTYSNILRKNNDSIGDVGTGYGIEQNFNNHNQYYFFLNNGTGYQGASITTTLNPNTWNHFSTILDAGNSIKHYLDGVLSANGTVTGSGPASSNDPFQIGQWSNQNDRFFRGYIKEVRVYNKALSSSEISFIYNGSGLDPGTSNLQALWTFDDDSALKDSSGNDNHGVGVGGASLKFTEGVLKR